MKKDEDRSVGFLRRWRLTIARRVSQLAILALFIGTARLGWSVAGRPLLSGDLSSSLIAGAVPLSDPFAVLQKLCALHKPELILIAGAAIVLAFYILVGGRAFCAWVCPMNIVTDAAASARKALGLKSDILRVSVKARYWIAAGALIGSAVSGTAAFEWLSPQGFLWREAVWGIGLGGAAAVLGIFALDLLVLPRGWCGHLCPLGAFWSLVGKIAVTKPVLDASKCDRCADCVRVCPEAGLISLKDAVRRGYIAGGECTSCGRCADICHVRAITFKPRFLARGEVTADAVNGGKNED